MYGFTVIKHRINEEQKIPPKMMRDFVFSINVSVKAADQYNGLSFYE